jgi:hypothetical protein
MSLRSRISDLTIAIRDKLNTMSPRLLPEGGADGQILIKKSDADFDTEWTQIGAWPPVIAYGTGAPQVIQLPELCKTEDVLVFVKGIFQHTGYSVVDDTLLTTQPEGFEIMVIRYGAGARGEPGMDSTATIDSVTGLNTALSLKSDVGHTHNMDEILGLYDELAELTDQIAQARADALNNSFEYTTPAASSSWVITHNLNRYPSVTCVDSAGTVFYGSVTYIDINTLKIDFLYETDGSAYLV